MIIGVDAGALSITDNRLRVGVWRVTLNLLKQLALIDTKNEYRLYTFAPIKERFGPNFKNVVVRPRFGWSRISLPLELARRPVDVFLGLSQMMPRCHAKKIGFVHDLAFLRFPEAYPDSYKRLKEQTEYLVAVSDEIITFSQSTARELHRKGIHVLYEGVDPIFTTKGKRYIFKKPYVLMVGALKRMKNIPRAVRICKATPYDLLLVGGDYWDDPAIEKEITRQQMSGRVRKLGYVSDAKLATLYRGAHALLITSHWEGFCLPAVEALACGCPVVYKRVGALNEIIGTKGLPFDTEKQAIHALLNPKKPAKFPAYSWRTFAKRVYEQY